MGRLKKTIFPLIFFLPIDFNSSRFLTSTTLALIPPLGVAIEPPKEHIFTLIIFPGLDSMLAYSKEPRTHFGTITGCNQTESRPIFINSFLTQSIALSVFNDPDKRPPIFLLKCSNHE